jgi:hypothetical protein
MLHREATVIWEAKNWRMGCHNIKSVRPEAAFRAHTAGRF